VGDIGDDLRVPAPAQIHRRHLEPVRVTPPAYLGGPNTVRVLWHRDCFPWLS
jgi:hypothetical protein